MDTINYELATTLRRGATRLREVDLPGELAARMGRLAEQVDQPCVVAVVGRVKAGKSTFINALLGQDLAKVGTTETTATINYFSHGIPDPELPVICHWRNGKADKVSREFVDSLQGNDIETLRRSDGIDHLEYRLLNPYLERATLVDTPGTGAAVDAHQNRTAEFMNLYSQLRERHSQETQQIGRDADAVIYLVGQATASTTDRDFLIAFSQITQDQARALNAIGVMAKIDLHPEILARRTELSVKIAAQLRESLNTVVPVSAGIHRVLSGFLDDGEIGLQRMIDSLRSVPPKRLAKLLDSEDLYLMEYDDCPITLEEREDLLGDMPWRVFTTIASVAADADLSTQAVADRLNTIAGFDALKRVLERHFFQRSGFLRCYRIASDARQALNDFKFGRLPELRKRNREKRARLERFLTFVQSVQGDPVVAQELRAYIQARLSAYASSEVLDSAVHGLEEDLSQVFHNLVEYNADFEALQQLQNHADLFSIEELDELRALLGLYGTETSRRLPLGLSSVESYVQKQQQVWRQKQWHKNPVRCHVAQRAVSRYGLVLREVMQG